MARRLELRVRTDDGATAGILLPRGSFLVGGDSAGVLPAAGHEGEPAHVLVVHGARRTLVRSLGPAALLNGQPFHEALLHGGDRLSIGPNEWDVQSHESIADSPGAQQTPETDGDDAGAAAADPVALLLDEPPTDASETSRETYGEAPPDGGETTAVGAVAAAEAAAHEPDAAPPSRDIHEGGVALAALEERFVRLCEDHDNMARERQRWLGGWNQAEAQLNTCVEQIHRKMAQLRDEHEAAAADLNERRRELLQEHDDLTQRFAALDRRLEEFATQQAAGLVERQAWQDEQRRLHEQLLARSGQIERKLDALSARQQSQEAKRPHAVGGEGSKSAGQRDAIDFRLAELRAEREALEEDLRLEQAERARTFLTEPATADAPADDSAAAESGLVCMAAETSEEPAPAAELDPAVDEALDPFVEPAAPLKAPIEAEATDFARATISLAELDSARRDDRPAPAEPGPIVELAERGSLLEEATVAAPAADIEFDPRQEPMPAAVSPTETVPFAPPRLASPASTAYIFAKLGLKPLVDDQPVDDPQADDQPAPDAPPAEATPEPESHGDREDESIENYMARLMDRVRGSSGVVSQAPRPQLGRRLVDAAPAYTPPQGTPAPVEVPPPPAEAPQPRVRVAPPESAADLSAMRELANMNARQALGSHQRRRMTSLMYGKLLLAVVSMVVAFTMIAMAVAGRPLYIFGAMLAATMTAVWSWQYLKLARQLAQATVQSASGENHSVSAGSAAMEAVPEAEAVNSDRSRD